MAALRDWLMAEHSASMSATKPVEQKAIHLALPKEYRLVEHSAFLLAVQRAELWDIGKGKMSAKIAAEKLDLQKVACSVEKKAGLVMTRAEQKETTKAGSKVLKTVSRKVVVTVETRDK